MKVILYMAISANGMIAKKDDDTDWISEEEWDSYSLAARTAGCLVVGYRTYHILTNQPEFAELKDVKLITVHTEGFDTSAPNHLVARSPQEALDLLSDFKEVIVAGGGVLNASFLSENLIDEIFLDVEPIILGEGIPVFKDKDFECKLKFIGQKMLSSDVIQLHYQVQK